MPPKTAKRGGRGSRTTPTGKINQPEAVVEAKKVEDLTELGVKVEKAVEEEEKPVETIAKVVEEERDAEMSLEDVEEENVVEKKPVKVEEETVVVQPSSRVEDESKILKEIKVEPQSEIEVEPVAEKGFAEIVVEELKESNNEDEKDECLDLEDNDQEYEREEYCGMDYDEKEYELEDYLEQLDEQSGNIEEENPGEQGIDDMGEEEIEEVDEKDDGRDGGQEQIEEADAEEDDHQEALKERRKRKEFEVFVGGLDQDATEEDLKKVFGKVGDVTEVRLIVNPQTKKNKAFAFLRFATTEQAKRAFTELKNPMVCGKPCGVSPSLINTDLGNGDKKAKVRARLSRPLQKSRGRHSNHSDSGRRHPPIRSGRGPLSRPLHSPPRHVLRRVSSRDSPVPLRRTVGNRERRQELAPPPRARAVYSPHRSYDRRPPAPMYPKSISTRDYRRVEFPPRSRPTADYDHRVGLDRRLSYREEYSPRVSGYPDISGAPPHSPVRRSYADDGYARRFERTSGYREGRPRNYDSVSRTKRPCSALDEPPPQYADGSVRHSRPRLDYEISASQYGDAYSERHGRTSIGYSSGRSLLSGHDSRGLYSSRQGSYGNSDVGGVYSCSSYAGDYPSRRPGVTSRSYSSLYSTRGAGSSSYIDSRGSGSYY